MGWVLEVVQGRSALRAQSVITVIAELAAINAAYGVIKSFVNNGRELSECGEQLSKFFDNKSKLQQKVNSTPLSQRNTLQEFFALEQVHQKERELKDLMLIAGRAGLWDDWQRFQRQIAQQDIDSAAQSAKAARKAKQDREEFALTLMAVFLMAFALSVILGLVYVLNM
jgi:hypothetical protein